METAAEHDPRADAASLPERLLVSLLAVGAVAGPFALRALDDNRLTSWRWVFADWNPVALFGLALAAAALGQVTARLPLGGRRAEAVLFLSALAAALPFWREPEVIVDAARVFTQAKHVEALGAGGFVAGWGTAFSAWTDLPLVPLLHGLAFAALGESRAIAQGLSTLLFALTVVLTVRLGRSLLGEEVGPAAGALLLAIPYLLTQVPLLLVDVPTMFFVALATWATVEAVRRGGAARVLLAALAVALAALTKYSAWLFLSAVPVIGLVHRRSAAPRPLRTAAAVALLGAALVLAALLPIRGAVSEQLGLLAGYQAPGLWRWGESFASTFLFQVHPFLAAGAVASAWLAFRRRDPRWLVAAWPVLLLLVLQVRRARYWIPAFPMLALLAAYGLQALRARETRRHAVGAAVACSLAVGGLAYLPFLERTTASNLRAAGRYLDAIPEEEAVVFAMAAPGAEVNPAVSVPLLDLHTGKRLAFRAANARPPPGVQASALRFTWEHRTPGWYGGEAAPGSAVVLITDALEAPPPAEVERRIAGLRLAATFDADEGVFAYRTLVRVYRAEGAGAARSR